MTDMLDALKGGRTMTRVKKKKAEALDLEGFQHSC